MTHPENIGDGCSSQRSHGPQDRPLSQRRAAPVPRTVQYAITDLGRRILERLDAAATQDGDARTAGH